ncbi:MAG: TetR/AcrR family transcriptional regulator [Frankiaceae bacterium]|nr:TetR/AcrR family transcriptional regulator [Frankiaceae bacterium]
MPAAQVSAPAADKAMRRDAARNLEKVLAAADAVFADRGLDATLADVADHAGVGVGTIYRRFADKGALVAALMDDKLVAVTATVEAAETEATGWDAFVRFLQDVSGQLLSDRALGQILIADPGQESANRLIDAIRPAATRILKRAQAEGVLRPEIRFNDVSPLLVMVTTTADFVAAGNPRVGARYLEVVLNGLRARPDQPALPHRALSDAELDAANRAASTRRR